MSPCSRCKNPPGLPSEEGTLFVAPPRTHTRGIMRKVLRQTGMPFEEYAEGVLAIELASGRLEKLSEAFGEAFSPTEVEDARALVVPPGVKPSVTDLVRTQSLNTLMASVRGRWLTEMVRDGRLTTHFQPIVSASDPSRVFAYECLLRGVDANGSLVSPGGMFEAARPAGLLFDLDREARLLAIKEATAHGISANVFVNFNPTSVYDPVYCLRSTMEAVEESPMSPQDIVFEVTESDEVKDVKHLVRIIDFYREAGFRIALDDLGAGYGSLNLMNNLRPDFVKLDLELVSGVHRDLYKAQVATKVLEMAQKLDVATVAEGVEHEEEWRWLAENGADFVQGYFFAAPASPPPVPAYA